MKDHKEDKMKKGFVDAMVIGVILFSVMLALNWGKPLGVVEKGTGNVITAIVSPSEMSEADRIAFNRNNPYSDTFR
jgi:hypothetical protein